MDSLFFISQTCYSTSQTWADGKFVNLGAEYPINIRE